MSDAEASGPKKFSFAKFLSDVDEDGNKTCCGGKTYDSWGKLLTFYVIFYLGLTGFWAMCFSAMRDITPGYSEGPQFDNIINDLDNENVYLNMQPGMWAESRDLSYSVRPGATSFGSGGDGSSLAGYLSLTDQSISVAETDTRVLGAIKTFCKGKDENVFGYDSNRPCFFLALNRIRGRGISSHGPPAGRANASIQEWEQDQDEVARATNGVGHFLRVECYLSRESAAFGECANAEPGDAKCTSLAGQFDAQSFHLVPAAGDDANSITETSPAKATAVNGFAFMPFQNNATRALRYRDPVVAVRLKEWASSKGGEESPERLTALRQFMALGDTTKPDDDTRVSYANLQCVVFYCTRGTCDRHNKRVAKSVSPV